MWCLRSGPARRGATVNLEAIWRQAKADLTLDDGRGGGDVCLWEHSARVARAAVMIAGLPGVSARPPELAALTVAALYHDAGWLIQHRDGLLARHEILSRATSDVQRELAAGMVEDRFARLLPSRSLSTAAQCLRRLMQRSGAMPEAQIVLDADNLDQVGVLWFWQAARRCLGDGKGMRAVIETWRRQKEYHFWEARIADAFHFEPVRALARRRLQRLEELMEELVRQYEGADVGELRGIEAVAVEQLPVF